MNEEAIFFILFATVSVAAAVTMHGFDWVKFKFTQPEPFIKVEKPKFKSWVY